MRNDMRNDTLFDSQNAAYAQAMFEEYARNPDAVPPEWRQVFEDGASRALAEGLIAPEQLDGFRARVSGAPRVRAAASAPAPSAP
jgi:2-oxoglutarate dehydrogenase complex dehydrogenase (E1) component-like enzyme